HRSRIVAGSSFDDDRALHAERLMRQAIELVRARLRALEGDRVGIVGIRHQRAGELRLLPRHVLVERRRRAVRNVLAVEGDVVRATGNGHELDALADLDSYRRWLERISRARADHLDGDRITGGAYGAHGWGWMRREHEGCTRDRQCAYH